MFEIKDKDVFELKGLVCAPSTNPKCKKGRVLSVNYVRVIDGTLQVVFEAENKTSRKIMSAQAQMSFTDLKKKYGSKFRLYFQGYYDVK